MRKTTRICFLVNDEQLKRIKEMSAKNEMTMTQYLLSLIKKDAEENGSSKSISDDNKIGI